MRLVSLLVLGLILCALPARAAQDEGRFTAAQLNNMCESKSNLDYGYCAGYVTAVADEMTEGAVGEFHACNHGFVKSQQYVDIFKAYIMSHPESFRTNAELAVAAAFQRAFPCH